MMYIKGVLLELFTLGDGVNSKIMSNQQSFTKHVRVTLVFMRNSGLRKKFNFCFSRVFW